MGLLMHKSRGDEQEAKVSFKEPTSFSLGNYFWLMLNILEHSKLIPRLESEAKILLFIFHNGFLLSKIVHLIKGLPVCISFSVTLQRTNITSGKISCAHSLNCNTLASFPILNFSRISVFLKVVVKHLAGDPRIYKFHLFQRDSKAKKHARRNRMKQNTMFLLARCE